MEKKVKSQRVNLFLNPNIVQRAKFEAVKKGVPLSKIVEDSLTAYLTPAIGVELTPSGTNFVSGPTITSLASKKSNPRRNKNWLY